MGCDGLHGGKYYVNLISRSIRAKSLEEQFSCNIRHVIGGGGFYRAWPWNGSHFELGKVCSMVFGYYLCLVDTYFFFHPSRLFGLQNFFKFTNIRRVIRVGGGQDWLGMLKFRLYSFGRKRGHVAVIQESWRILFEIVDYFTSIVVDF